MSRRYPKYGSDFVREISETRVPEGSVIVWHLNQFGYAFKSNRHIIYIDPYLSNDLVDATLGKPDQHTKIFEPLLKGSDITNADYVICTHDHLDHLDPTCVKEIFEASTKTKFIVTKQSVHTMTRLGIDPDRIIYVDADETHEIADGLTIHTFKGAHEDFDYDEELGYAYLGFHIDLEGIYLYHSGDTVLFNELVEEVKKFSIDLAFLPINGREYQKHRGNIMGNMNFKEAAEFAVEIGAEVVFPGHWGMHYENTERPGNFVDYITEKHRFQRFHVMVPGDKYYYIK